MDLDIGNGLVRAAVSTFRHILLANADVAPHAREQVDERSARRIDADIAQGEPLLRAQHTEHQEECGG